MWDKSGMLFIDKATVQMLCVPSNKSSGDRGNVFKSNRKIHTSPIVFYVCSVINFHWIHCRGIETLWWLWNTWTWNFSSELIRAKNYDMKSWFAWGLLVRRWSLILHFENDWCDKSKQYIHQTGLEQRIGTKCNKICSLLLFVWGLLRY